MPPKKRKSTTAPGDDDPDRVAEKRRLNREAAQRCRQRRKENYNQLKQDYLDIDCANVAKQQEIRQLLKMKEELEALLRDHQCVLQSVSQGGTTGQPSAALGAPLEAPRASEATTPPGQNPSLPGSQGQNPSLPGQNPSLPGSQGQNPSLPGQHTALTGSHNPGLHPLAQGQGHDSQVAIATTSQSGDRAPITVAIVTDQEDGLPDDLQSQLLSRFLSPGGHSVDSLDVTEERHHDVHDQDVQDVLDVQEDDELDLSFETTVDLSAIGGSHVPVEHSYCHGGDLAREDEEL